MRGNHLRTDVRAGGAEVGGIRRRVGARAKPSNPGTGRRTTTPRPRPAGCRVCKCPRAHRLPGCTARRSEIFGRFYLVNSYQHTPFLITAEWIKMRSDDAPAV